MEGQHRGSRCGEPAWGLGKNSDGIYRCVAWGPGPAPALRGSFSFPKSPNLFTKPGGRGFWVTLLYLLP